MKKEEDIKIINSDLNYSLEKIMQKINSKKVETFAIVDLLKDVVEISYLLDECASESKSSDREHIKHISAKIYTRISQKLKEL